MSWLGVALLGGSGAVLRVLLARGSVRGTLLVNLGGALALGLLAGAGLDGDARLLLGGGFLGAFTTFSTWVDQGRRSPLLLGGALVLGLGAVALGRLVGGAL